MRNRDLNDLGNAFVSSNKGAIDVATNNKNLANRQNEINEWAYGNKLDTLFVFQLIFISLCVLAAIAFAAKMGFISNTLVGILIGIEIVIMILLISNRAIYTDKVRNKRYWNKRIYGVVGSSLPGGIQKCK